MISAVLTSIISLIILLSIYGVPDLSYMFEYNSYRKYCPGFIKKQVTALAWKQYISQSNSCNKNVHVRNFFLLYDDHVMYHSKNEIECKAIVYGRYCLTMKIKFTKNFLKTDIDSYYDPVFELTELKSITDVGALNSWSSEEKTFYLSLRGSKYKFVATDQSKTFGIETWNSLVADKGNLEVVDHKVIKDQPLKVAYDFTGTEKAAREGDPDSQKFLAMAYYQGYRVTKDYHKSMEWYKKLAMNTWSHPCGMAEFHIGSMFFYGEGVEKDYSTAESWFRKSADKGYSRAFTILGIMNEGGLGVSKNSVEAENGIKRRKGK